MNTLHSNSEAVLGFSAKILKLPLSTAKMTSAWMLSTHKRESTLLKQSLSRILTILFKFRAEEYDHLKLLDYFRNSCLVSNPFYVIEGFV